MIRDAAQECSCVLFSPVIQIGDDNWEIQKIGESQRCMHRYTHFTGEESVRNRSEITTNTRI